MGCPCICTNILDYCNANICDGTMDFDVLANIDGEHKLITDFLGIEIELTETFSIGDRIVFDISRLNENYQYTCELFNPDGVQITINKDSVQYDCFKFQTKLKIAV